MSTITPLFSGTEPPSLNGARRVPGRVARGLAAWWQDRRDTARARADSRARWRALQALDSATRRDLGLAEGGPAYDPTLDIERCRW